MSKKGFTITDGKGFHLKFSNGWSISVQFGIHNYCENQSMSWANDANIKAGENGSDTAEIAIIQPDGEFFQHPDYPYEDDVCGYRSANDVSGFIAWTAAQPPAGSP